MSELKYLITGADGMLGRDLQVALEGRQVASAARKDLDITDLEAVRAAVTDRDVVINAAAYTAVDAAESDEDAAYAVNARGAQNLAIAAAENRARLIQLSTDYVFAGTASEPYREDAPLEPVSAYGRTKAAGERLARAANPDATFIVRTAWLYGAHGPNFVATMLRLAASHTTVSVVNDQVGAPTWTRDLADRIVALLDAHAPAGVYHATNSGRASWYQFAQAIFSSCGLDPARVTPTVSSEFVRPAPRPAFSVLGHDGWGRIGMPSMRDWEDALADAASQGVLEHDGNTSGSR